MTLQLSEIPGHTYKLRQYLDRRSMLLHDDAADWTESYPAAVRLLNEAVSQRGTTVMM